MNPEEKEEKIIEERKKKAIIIIKKSWVALILIIAILLGVYIRYQPLANHNGKPGLWDITTNDYTLGPDLDPFLFLRYSEYIVDNGKLMSMDYMRNVPLGFDTSIETRVLPYMMAYFHKIIAPITHKSINYSAALFPVFAFALTIIVFFLFVREIFIKEKIKANIIALISTMFMIVIPIFLSRTVAGIPEKESAAFLFMFLAFFLFLKSWKTENLKNAVILAVCAGISTSLMGLIWGAVGYIFVSIALASFIAFILNKIGKKETFIFSTWLVVSLIIMDIFSAKYSIKGIIAGLDTGVAFFVFFIILLDFALWKRKMPKIKFMEKIPHNICSIIYSTIILAVLVSLFFGFDFIFLKLQTIHQTMFKPVTGRWSMTVAENRQPYFTEWGSSFGPFLKKIPILFWLFCIGSIVAFKKMLKNINNKDAWVLTGMYVLFFLSLVFSRYAPHPHLFDGEGLISKFVYYGSALLLVGGIIYYYMQYYKKNDKSFESIDYEYLVLFALFVLTIFTARSAVRLIMVAGPIAPIFAAYLMVNMADETRRIKDEVFRVIFAICAIIIILLGAYSFFVYYPAVKSESYGFIPSYYTNQWQKAMSWVRENTDKNAVFSHWWDYGYWVQSIGKRASVTDGGNAIVYWNYLSGRYLLTGDNQKDALNFLYSHNATHLLIDSSDLGKYGAFSNIGSNKDFDRISQGPIGLTSDARQIQETKDRIIRSYNILIDENRVATSPIEEDIITEINGTKINLFKEKTGFIGIVGKYALTNNSSMILFEQPEASFVSNGKQLSLPMRYLYYKGKFYDFKTGIEATAYIMERAYNSGNGMQIDNLGAAMYISPRLMRGLLSQTYLLNNSLGNFDSFKLVHSEPNPIIEYLNQQGANLNEFIYFNGIQGPIKIWEIEYTGKEEKKEEYLLTRPPASIDWQF